MNELSWTYSGTNPTVWRIFGATSIGGPYSSVGTVGGGVRTYGFSVTGHYYYIEGQDGSGNQENLDSNIVQSL